MPDRSQRDEGWKTERDQPKNIVYMHNPRTQKICGEGQRQGGGKQRVGGMGDSCNRVNKKERERERKININLDVIYVGSSSNGSMVSNDQCHFLQDAIFIIFIKHTSEFLAQI